MRIAIITSDSFFSYLLISDIVKNRTNDISCIVITPSTVKGKGKVASVIHVFKKTGFRNVAYKVITYTWICFAELLHKCKLIRHGITPSNLAETNGIDMYHSQNCNDDETLTYLRSRDIDILLSINVYQRMLEPLLALPRITAINNHFGLLPKYKGMAPYIWAMADGETEIGLSVHHMVLEFDEGKLIKQKRMPVNPGDSAMGVYIRACLIARRMISQAVVDVETDSAAGFIQKGEGSYFSMPTRDCISRLYQNGHCLWKLRDLFSVFQNKIDGERLP